MATLRTLVQTLSQLAQQHRWQDILDHDNEIRQTITQFTKSASPTEKIQGIDELRAIQKIYQDGVEYLEGGQLKSATEMKSLQKGLRAAKSYLDHTKF
jgi:Tfp pilus assembly protein PilF